MARVTQNFENRVRKLPKPSNAGQALQPLFEAISNAVFAIDDLKETLPVAAQKKGLVRVEVRNLSDSEKLKIDVIDDGIGLDANRYKAFKELDTEFKRSKGGKGVGRLFWLDAFSKINVVSAYKGATMLDQRSFDFVLSNDDQIIEHASPEAKLSSIGTNVRFSGLRSGHYAKHFPKRKDTFLNYFSAHFIADFLGGSGPRILVNLDGDFTEYPQAVSDLVVGDPIAFQTNEHEQFGVLSIQGFFCKEMASKGLDGMHQLHLLANKRTVSSREIDKLLGLLRVSKDGQDDLVFHGCVSGDFLDDHVNEGRTAFVLEEKTLKEVSRFCADSIKANALPEQIEVYEQARLHDYREFVAAYPIYDFAEEAEQLKRVPFGARTPEEFAAGLVKHQIRGEETRRIQIDTIIDQLDGEKNVPENFGQTVVEVAKDLKASEQRALAHHVVKRKLVLEVMERLILKVRDRGEEKRDFHLEETLHTFICPMRITGREPTEIEPSPHDLWIVDERLAFTRSFSSDVRLQKLLKDNPSELRPDLVVWDQAHGLSVLDPREEDGDIDLSEPLRKVMVVEFKRPGRRSYPKVEDDIERQITKYLRHLKGGEVFSYDQRKVRFSDDCQFFCYVVADIEGDLKDQLITWNPTANGEGRFRALDGAFKGSSIEVIQWTDLINDAWSRNMATLSAAGLRRGRPTVSNTTSSPDGST
ncbi:MAG: hypothetical protein ACJA1J_000774 [Sulfitobacter pontiacus]|jgi:hypothetical protein